MLAVPIVHGPHAVPFTGFCSPCLPNVLYDSTHLRATMIVDAKRRILATRSLEEGAGVVLADTELTEKASPVDPIPSVRF